MFLQLGNLNLHLEDYPPPPPEILHTTPWEFAFSLWQMVRILDYILETIHVGIILLWLIININPLYKMWTTFLQYPYNVTSFAWNTLTQLGSTHLIQLEMGIFSSAWHTFPTLCYTFYTYMIINFIIITTRDMNIINVNHKQYWMMIWTNTDL